MASVSHGTAHLHGVNGTIASATVTDFSEDSTNNNEGEVFDESGNSIERRYDDITETATIGIIITSGYSIPAVATTLLYDGSTYEITAVNRVENHREFRKVTLSLKKSEYISYA